MRIPDEIKKLFNEETIIAFATADKEESPNVVPIYWKIIVDDGIARGVEARCQGSELKIEAKAVASNAGPKKTVALAGEHNFDRGYLKEVRELRPMPGLFFILSSDGPLYDWPGGLNNSATIESSCNVAPIAAIR